METQFVIEVSDLTKKFGRGSNTVTAVDGLNLKVERGQIYGVLGPNGAGKTTTIKMISGMLRPDSGSIRIAGHGLMAGRTQMNHLATRALGLCPQELVIWDGLTLMEQLLFMAKMYDIPQAVAMERATGLLGTMGLYDKRNKLGRTLSGGMKRRLNILLALMHEPDVLILDEPQAGLDPQSRVLIREYLMGLSKHKTVLVTTHDMEEADKICDRVAIVDHGKVLTEDVPTNLKKSLFKGDLIEFEMDEKPELSKELMDTWHDLYGPVTYYGHTVRFSSEKPAMLMDGLQAQMKLYGMTVQDIRIRKASLEDVFISLTGRGLRE